MGGRRRAMRGATEGAGDGWQTTGLHRLRDRDPAEGGVCPIGGARGPLIAQANPMGGSVALCPGGHLMRPRTLQQFASICATSQLVQYPAKWCNTTYGQALAWARSAYRTREGATLHQLGMQCTTEHGNAPAIRQCIASTRGALPLISGVTCPQMRTRTHLATMRDHSQPIKWRHPAGLCTRCVALHPLRGAAPVAGRCTRSERVQCPRIGCNAHGSGVPRSQARTRAEPGTPQRERRRPKRPYTRPGTW